MVRIRPTEHRAIVALLDAPAESVEELATDVIQKIDELREARPDFFVVVVDPGVGVKLIGPYLTKNAAHKAIASGEVFAASPGATGLVLQRISSIEPGLEPDLFTQGGSHGVTE